jgi:hypothetical protein
MIWIILVSILAVFIFLYLKKIDNDLLKTVTNTNRGTATERDLVLKLLKSQMPAEAIFHDLYLQKPDGKYSQIDLVLITNVGMIIFEVKKYKGWLFGTGYKSHWVQVLAYGKRKCQFYNPVIQNNVHVQNLKIQLGQKDLPFFSIVVFYGDCVLKEINFIPNGTFVIKSERTIELLKKILKENPLVCYNNNIEIFRVLREAVKNGESLEIQKRHAQNIQDILRRDRVFD